MFRLSPPLTLADFLQALFEYKAIGFIQTLDLLPNSVNLWAHGYTANWDLSVSYILPSKTCLRLGANDTVDEAAGYMGLDQLAADKGFLLVYLRGRILNWPPSICLSPNMPARRD
jgi:hypothetical protein